MNITIYSKHNCPYCLQIKKIAEHLKVTKNYQVVVYNLDEHFTKEQFYQEFGVGSTFPQVLLDDHKTGGCTDTVKYLRENNIL